MPKDLVGQPEQFVVEGGIDEPQRVDDASFDLVSEALGSQTMPDDKSLDLPVGGMDRIDEFDLRAYYILAGGHLCLHCMRKDSVALAFTYIEDSAVDRVTEGVDIPSDLFSHMRAEDVGVGDCLV